MCLKKNKIIQ